MENLQKYVNAAYENPERHARRIQTALILIRQNDLERLATLVQTWFGPTASLEEFRTYLNEYGFSQNVS